MEGFDLRSLLNPEHWIAMDGDGEWFLHKNKPPRGGWCWRSGSLDRFNLRKDFFNIPECENWEESRIQVKDLIKA